MKEPIGAPVYENDLFVVRVVEFTDPVLNETVDGYGIINKATGIREAESRREFTARALADGFEDQHKNPERYIAPPSGYDFSNTGSVAH